MSNLFHYLEYLTTEKNLPDLHTVGQLRLLHMAFEEDSYLWRLVLLLIKECREGNINDYPLLKNIMYTFLECGGGQMSLHRDDIEEKMLCDSAAYYSQMAYTWIIDLEYTFPDYLLKAEEWLKREEAIVSFAFRPSCKTKFIEKAIIELLLSDTISRGRMLFKDNKKDDISRMYTLFSRIPEGLDAIIKVFEQECCAEASDLITQAENGATNMADALVVKTYVMKIIQWHDKYLAYLKDCLGENHHIRMRLWETCEVILDKHIHGRSGVDCFAIYSDLIIRKAHKNSQSFEDIKGSLKKAIEIGGIKNVDDFGKRCWKTLSHRLLHGFTKDHEEKFITMLEEHGVMIYLTSKMKDMLEDKSVKKKKKEEEEKEEEKEKTIAETVEEYVISNSCDKSVKKKKKKKKKKQKEKEKEKKKKPLPLT